MTSADTTGSRRPIRARSSAWAAAWANDLVRRGVAPNTISLASIACAAVGGFGLVLTRFSAPAWLLDLAYLLSIAGIQGRLLCNLLDGMVAVEGGKAGPLGQVYNDLPDRLADPILLVAAGYGMALPFGAELGWLAAIGALLTAYVRVLGRSIGTETYFVGPMAKQHRMAVLTGACAIAALAAWWDCHRWIMFIALLAIIAGCVWTILRRLKLIFRDLEAKGGKAAP